MSGSSYWLMLSLTWTPQAKNMNVSEAMCLCPQMCWEPQSLRKQIGQPVRSVRWSACLLLAQSQWQLPHQQCVFSGVWAVYWGCLSDPAVSSATRENSCWTDFAAPGLPLLTPLHGPPPHPYIRVLAHFIDGAVLWAVFQGLWRGPWVPLFRLGCQQFPRQLAGGVDAVLQQESLGLLLSEWSFWVLGVTALLLPPLPSHITFNFLAAINDGVPSEQIRG